jgi:hypothetical protein
MSCHPLGEVMLVGLTGIKLSPGIQENQNVPSVVVPVLLSAKLYWELPGLVCMLLIVALATSAPYVTVANILVAASAANLKHNELLMTIPSLSTY